MARRKQYDPDPTTEICAVPGCGQPAPYRAPKSRQHLNEYQYFCLDHIREFNKTWDYFSGMQQADIEAFQKDATLGHRPTWRIDEQSPHEKLEAAFAKFMDPSARRKAQESYAPPASQKDREALAVMDLEHPVTQKEIKARYKHLVKKYHPDRNQNNKQAEELFKKVTLAYHHLSHHYKEPA